MSESKSKDDLIGKTLGQYEILEEIGRGGMATVYRARQLSINRVVAVKVLPRHLLHDPGFFERFEREVDVIAHLEHPHILPIYDYGKADDVPYIAMRYLAGGSLAQLIRRGQPPLEDLDRPFTQVAQALDYAHRQGIIHRDIKPGNIMLDEAGNAYLSDFGIARVLGSNLTGSAIIGTPAYMSPEQANGLPLDARSDIYALGVVLFELITGREPYQAETPMALLLKHINEPMPPISMFRQQVPLEVEQVIFKATAKDPGQRYSSAGDMARDFSEALRGRRQTGAAGEDTPTIIPEGAVLGRATPPTPTPYPPYQAPPPAPTPYPPYQTPPPAPYSQPTPYPAQPTPYGQPVPHPPGAPPPTPYPPAAPRRRSLLPLLIGGLVVVVGLVVTGLVVVPNLTPREALVTLVPQTLGTPTPFASAQLVQTDEYSIAVPRVWIPPQGFYDLSDAARQVHVWQDTNLQAYVALALVEADVSSPDRYAAAAARYRQQYFEQRGDQYRLIDSAIAPDGTRRDSYRAEQPPFPPGQVDVFYLQRAPYLAVLEVFSSDVTGNAFVPTFQQILDSVRIKPVAN